MGFEDQGMRVFFTVGGFILSKENTLSGGPTTREKTVSGAKRTYRSKTYHERRIPRNRVANLKYHPDLGSESSIILIFYALDTGTFWSVPVSL